jgi:hypothetical protein
MNRVDEKRLDDIVFACAVGTKTPRSMRELQAALARYRGDDANEADWRGGIVASIERLRRDGRLDDRRGRGPRGSGTAMRWSAARDRILPALALGLESMKGPMDKDDLAAAIVARDLGLWTEGLPPSAASTADALVWRELGLRGKAKRLPDQVRAHFLRQRLRDSKGDGDAWRWLRQLAAQIIGAPSTSPESLRTALVARWLAGESLTKATAAVPLAVRSTRTFAEAVREAAHGTRDGRFGDRQVFIVSVWRNLRSDNEYGDLSLDDFKRRLIEAHRAGQLALVRADLVGVMDPTLVAESEITHLEARYHFLLEEAA